MKLEAIEQKMISGQALTPDEQDAYDVASREVSADTRIPRASAGGSGRVGSVSSLFSLLVAKVLVEKVAWLDAQLKKMVDDGQITMGEKQQLKTQLEGKLASIKTELDEAKAEEKPKKVDKLVAQVALDKSVTLNQHPHPFA